MKNIFDFLLSDQNVLNEKLFDSFSDWMFPGNNLNDHLSRSFLRWSVLYITQNSPDKKPENIDFYAFFSGLDQNIPETFISCVSEFENIKEEVTQVLGNDPADRDWEAISEAFIHFLGVVMEHVANESLFPEDKPVKKRTPRNPLNASAAPPLDKNESAEFKRFSNVIYLLFVLFITVFVLFNFFMTR